MKQVRLLEEHFTYHDLGTNTYYEYKRTEFTLRYHVEDNVWELERLNYRLYEGINNAYQIRKINGKYDIIDLHSPHRQRVVNKIKFDMIASIKRYGITSDILSDVSLMNLTIKDILNMEVEDES